MEHILVELFSGCVYLINNGIIIAFGLMGIGVSSVNFGISFTNIPIAVSSAIWIY